MPASNRGPSCHISFKWKAYHEFCTSGIVNIKCHITTQHFGYMPCYRQADAYTLRGSVKLDETLKYQVCLVC